MFKEFPGRAATFTMLTDRSNPHEELMMRTVLRSEGRHAHRKDVLSADQHTGVQARSLRLGIRPRLFLRLGGLKRSHENPTDSKFRVTEPYG